MSKYFNRKNRAELHKIMVSVALSFARALNKTIIIFKTPLEMGRN